MAHKADVLAFDREKRVYKDVYVDNFRRVRHFPALAAIGAGRSDGDSVILVQDAGQEGELSSAPRSKMADVASRLMPTNPVDDMFATTPPLTMFRTAVMSKHTNARREAASLNSATGSEKTSPTSGVVSTGLTPRYSIAQEKTIFKLLNAADAKSTIARKVSYDSEAYRDRPMNAREMSSPHGKPEWVYNNPMVAREDVRTRKYFHVPPEGVLKADRKYTQEFITQHVEAYEQSRQQVTRARLST